MGYLKRFIDFLTLGSTRPIRRLAAYYIFIGVIGTLLFKFIPTLQGTLTGERLAQNSATPSLLQDGLAPGEAVPAPAPGLTSRVEFAVNIAFVFLSTLVLMLPVSWVYMSARPGQGHNQSVVQVLIVLPMIIAGIVLVVQNSLALAFSLAGVVAAVRFRTTLTDTRDVVYIFLAIGVGFAAGVNVTLIAFVLTIFFNFVLVLIWRYDFGRLVLEPTAAVQWAAPLEDLATKDGGGNKVPDRDLVIALTPSKVEALAKRFDRVRDLLGDNGKKPRYNAILTVMTTKVSEAQAHVERVLDQVTKRWKFDEVVQNTGKPSELYYLIRTRKAIPREGIITAIRSDAAGLIDGVDVEIGDALAREAMERRRERKQAEKVA